MGGRQKWENFPVHNPSTGEVIVNVPDMEIEDLREAIDGAYEAQKAWAAKTAKEKCHS